MSKTKKIALIAGVVIAVAVVVWATIYFSQKNVVAVQTGKVAREDLTSVVTASGEIKPKDYVNIGANAFGKITKLYVKEGDHVKKGQLLAQLENVQSASDVAATRASLEAARTDAVATEAGLKTAQAQVEQSQAQLEQAKLDYERARGLYQDQLIAKADFDAKKAAYDSAVAGLAQAKARVAQSKAQLESAHRRVTQTQATLVKSSDLLSKTEYLAPYDGVITNLPVREGETVVIGIQNAPGSTLMTLSDLSVITAEVKVDETDIVSVKLGQPATVTIDAMPNKTFHGTVTEIGDNAIVRSTGVSTAQTTGGSQEAKDFKVVVTLSDPPENLRPGLSTTAKVTTATRQNALAVPIQALTIRRASELQEKSKNAVEAAAPAKSGDKKDGELQGVFVVRNKHAVFVPVQTGITGTTDIEITSGLKEGDEIVTGSYKVLRTLRNNAAVKIEKTPAPEESSS